jgi:tripartite ATP-independent transporter DctM subunit
MSTGLAVTLLFAGFLLLMVLRVPVAFALGVACVPLVLLDPRLGPMVVFNESFKSFNSFILLAVPFFLLSAQLMNVGGITHRLLRLSRALVGHWPGGLAQVNVLLSVFFAGISGSATADAASQGKLFIEAQVKEGYSPGFSVAVTAVSSLLSAVIPPSIMMVVWAGVMPVSVGGLFVAGVLPGLVLAASMMLVVHVCSVRRGYPTHAKATLVARLVALRAAIPAMLTPFIIIGGKVFGWFTATEASVIAVLYALALSCLVYREAGPKQLAVAFTDTAEMTGAILLCVGTASVFGWLLAFYQVPQYLLQAATAWQLGPLGAGLFVAGVFLVVGCFLDAIPAIIIVGTLLEPMAMASGLDPLHYALIGIVSLAFGLVTPPYGLCLLICCSIAKLRIADVMRDFLLFLLPCLIVLASIIALPELYLWPVRLFGPALLE